MKRQKIKTLEEAFATVDHLVEHYDETSHEKKKKFDKRKDKSTQDDALKSNDKSKTMQPLKRWICAETHMVKNCPSRLKVAAMAQPNAKKEETYVGVKQILGAATTAVVVS